MKCAKCGAELKTGCIYCSVCGQEAQIVSDYNLLEDDFLRDLLKEEEKKNAEKQNRRNQGKTSPVPPRKKKKKTPVIAGAIGAIILLIVLIVLLVNHSHNNSYDYQFDKAEGYVQDKEYAKAQKYLERAIELQENSTEALMLLADVYLAQDEKDDAIEALKAVINLEGNNKEAYRKLIALYDELQDYEAITKLSEGVKDNAVMDLFSDYLVTAPVIESEKYDEEEGIEVFSQSGTTTYYTLDGSDPKSGTEYEGPVFLEEGTTTIRLISVNELGIYSEEAEYTFEVEYEPPEAPEVTPDGGTFSTPQPITIDVPSGCRAYYTWDGTEPTANSEQYTAPLEMPEGNNILSVILVNEKGRWSDVTKCNFIYLP